MKKDSKDLQKKNPALWTRASESGLLDQFSFDKS
jgi:hypothetical protein